MQRSERRLRMMTRKAEKTLARQVYRAFTDLKNSIPVDRIEQALASRNMFAIHDLVGTLPMRLRQTLPVVNKTFAAGVMAGRAALPKARRRV